MKYDFIKFEPPSNVLIGKKGKVFIRIVHYLRVQYMKILDFCNID